MLAVINMASQRVITTNNVHCYVYNSTDGSTYPIPTTGSHTIHDNCCTIFCNGGKDIDISQSSL